MSLTSNLLQLIFSLVVGIASLLGALFIIGFLLAVPRNEFGDDDHDVTQPIFVPPLEPDNCPILSGPGLLPVNCSVVGTNDRNFTSTGCDNTVCNGCSEDENVSCCCQPSNMTSFQFQCVGSEVRRRLQPDFCTCQPCADVTVQLAIQVISSSDSSILRNAKVNIFNSAVNRSLPIDSAGFFNTFRSVNERTVQVNVTEPGHFPQSFDVEIIPPGPLQIFVILSAAVVQDLGTNNKTLNFSVSAVADVTIPPNSVVTSTNETFTGSVTVRISSFSNNQSSSYSDDFPPQVTTQDASSGAVIFYATSIVARAVLTDQDGNPLSTTSSLNVSVDLSQFNVSSGGTITFLIYNDNNNTWSELPTVTTTPTVKRQANRGTVTAMLPRGRADAVWAAGVGFNSDNSSRICYLQVRAFQRDNELSGVTVSVEQFTDEVGYFRNTEETGNNELPSNVACLEVLCGAVSLGRVTAESNQATLTPRASQPAGVSITGDTINFTRSTEVSDPSPFYSNQELCVSASANVDGSFVSFELPVEPPSSDIPPEEPVTEYWFIRVQALSCEGSMDRITTASVDPNTNIPSTASSVVPATGETVNVFTTTSCGNNPVVRHTICIEAFTDSRVTVQAEEAEENRLCRVSELTNVLNNSLLTRNDGSVVIDLPVQGNNTDGNEMAGLYRADSRLAAMDNCLSATVSQTFQGLFAQFECFERPPDSVEVVLPAGCTAGDGTGRFNSQSCSEVPCTTLTGDCVMGNGVQCCYRELSTSNVAITCPPYNPLNLNQPQTCTCLPCDDINIDVVVTVTSSIDGSPIIMAMVDYNGTNDDISTDGLGMFTVTAPISADNITFTVMAPNYVPDEQHLILLIPPGPIRVNVVLQSQDTESHGNTPDEVIDVSGIANVTFVYSTVVVANTSTSFSGNVMSTTTFFAAERRRSFDAALPPNVVTTDGESTTFYAVRIIAATRLVDSGITMMRLSSPAMVETTFTPGGGQPDNSTFLLLTLAEGMNWSVESSTVEISSISNTSVTARASLPSTELTWAIADPLSSESICYVQVRTFRRDNSPLGLVNVEVLQFINQFGREFFFRSDGVTGGLIGNSACLPLVCNSLGMIRAIYHVYLQANEIQPGGLTAAGIAVNISGNGNSLFSSQAACVSAANGPYARFDLPIPNPPPTDIEPPENNNGFVFLRVSWQDCFDSNRISTISYDRSNNDLLAVYSNLVSESGEINDDTLEDPTNSGMMTFNCSDGPRTTVTTRTTCIQAEPNANVTLQVELNPQSDMYNATNERCSLTETIGSFMASSTDNRVMFNITTLENTNALNNMGIYYDARSANVARDRCMNSTSTMGAQLNGSIAIFSCFTV